MSTYVRIFTACPGIWSEVDYRRFRRSKYRQADPKNFKNWWTTQSDVIKNIIAPCKSDPRWGTIRHVTMIKKNDGRIKRYPRNYLICLDPNSDYAGHIYNGDSRLAIYMKIFQSVLARPLHLVTKTLYHASLIGVARAIFCGVWHHKPTQEIRQKIVHNLIDIVRTPVYEIALTIISLVGLIVIPFSPVLAYDFRAQIGHLSHELYWGRRHGFLIDLTPCMRKKVNIMDLELNPQAIQKKYLYSDASNPILVGLENGFEQCK